MSLINLFDLLEVRGYATSNDQPVSGAIRSLFLGRVLVDMGLYLNRTVLICTDQLLKLGQEICIVVVWTNTIKANRYSED